MKIGFSVLSVILLLSSCIDKTTTAPDTNGEPVNEITLSVSEDNNDKVTEEEAAPLIIGGRQYRGRLGDWVTYPNEWGGATIRLAGDPVNCTVDDINKILIVSLWIDPEDPERRNSL